MPNFTHYLRNSCFRVCRRRKPKKEQKESQLNQSVKDELLLSFVNSAFNVEFVYLILLGVGSFMEIQVLDSRKRSMISSAR